MTFKILDEGATVAVVAVSGPVPQEQYAAGLKILGARYRLKQIYDPQIKTAAPFPYLAGDDAERAQSLRQALADPEISAIFFARGGFGAMRLLPLLDAAPLRKSKIPLVGFSDITALHAWAAGLGISTVHGPTVTQLSSIFPEQIEEMFALLEGKRLPTLTNLKPLALGRARGKLRGGNLTVLSHLCGTPFQLKFQDSLLLLEDVDEAPYRVDRLLTHLELAGVFNQVRGIILGEFKNCDGLQGRPPTLVAARQVLATRLSNLGIPVVCDAPVGHGHCNLALPLEIEAELDAKQGTLTFIPSAGEQ